MPEMPEPEYIKHPNIKEEALESRAYQEVIAAKAQKDNTICVLPTGLGKTAVAILTAAHRLKESKGGKVLVLAPTKPLVDQHRKSFQEALKTETEIFETLTGDTRPEKREEKWKEVGCFFATPQVVENDLIAKRLDLEQFSIVVFDECHRATGEYPYKFIADKYLRQGEDPRILGLTASPGSDREKIEQVAEDLHIANFEVRTEDDSDVEPYIQRKEINWIKTPLNRHFKRCKKHLENAKKDRVKELSKKGYLKGGNITRKDLLKARGKIQKKLSKKQEPELFWAVSKIAACMKIDHALELLETQGTQPLYRFLQDIKDNPGSKAEKRLLEDEDFQNALAVSEWMYRNNKNHPKLEKLEKLVKNKFTKGDTAIVFTQYRNTVDSIKEMLEDIDYIEPVKFKGQKDGFTQKKQLEIIESFRDGEYNVLCSTSIGEEGLDIPNVDYVVFYEPVPSEIRSIQRKGRTGRQKAGNVYVLMAENTRDESYYWSSKHKEDKMKKVLKDLQDKKPDMEGQQTMDRFVDKEDVVIYADDRENKIAKQLSRKDIEVRTKRLEIADFIVSDRTAVERKTCKDFVDSIVDKRLFTQVKELKEQFENPILIIEGDTLYKHRKVHPNAIRGAVASLALDYQIPVIWTEGREETVENLIALARREQEEQDRGISIRGEKTPKSEPELQKFIVSGLPNISDRLAERLLNEFGTVKDVFTASETELEKVEGIGESKAQRIREIVDKQFKD
ncbi:MAG: DEAD/DEAH box helicase [Candidatus Nanohaloarchaea archaeon]|nr:DEAD/DEAH box helicase [Candidatus Nanohaloarchaea archaeon]